MEQIYIYNALFEFYSFQITGPDIRITSVPPLHTAPTMQFFIFIERFQLLIIRYGLFEQSVHLSPNLYEMVVGVSCFFELVIHLLGELTNLQPNYIHPSEYVIHLFTHHFDTLAFR